MKYFKNSTAFRDELEPNILMAKSEDGEDWYESQKDFSESTVKVLFIAESGYILSYNTDVTKMFPDTGTSVLEVDKFEPKEDMQYIINPETSEISENEDYKRYVDLNTKISTCNNQITTLKERIDEVDFGLIKDTKPTYKSQLGEWVKARMALSNFDLSSKDEVPSIPSINE